MNTNVEQKTIDAEKLSEKGKEFILKMFAVRESSFNEKSKRSPHELLLSNIIEAIYDELRIKDSDELERKYPTDWGHIFWEYKNSLKEILVLLGNAKVNKYLPKYVVKSISTHISNLINFFDYINNDESVYCALDLFFIENYLNNESVEKGKRILENYDFDQRGCFNQFWKRYCYPPEKELDIIQNSFAELGSPTFEKLLEDAKR